MKNKKVFDQLEKVSIQMVNMPIKHDKVAEKRQFVYCKGGFVFMNYRQVFKKKQDLFVKWC